MTIITEIRVANLMFMILVSANMSVNEISMSMENSFFMFMMNYHRLWSWRMVNRLRSWSWLRITWLWVNNFWRWCSLDHVWVLAVTEYLTRFNSRCCSY